MKKTLLILLLAIMANYSPAQTPFAESGDYEVTPLLKGSLN